MVHQTSPLTTTSDISAGHWQSDSPPTDQAGVQWACRLGATQGHLDLLRPQSGVVIRTNPTMAIELLGIQLGTEASMAAPLIDSWVRSADAYAIYEPTDSRRLRTTAQWRLSAISELSGRDTHETVVIELVVSTQTSRVASDGATASICRLPAADLRAGYFLNGQLQWSEEGEVRKLQQVWDNLPSEAVYCLICNQQVTGTSFGLLVRRDEARHLLFTPGSTTHDDPMVLVTTWFFPTLIEKGVLHRGRIRAVVGSPSGNPGWITAAAAAFAAEPPLLL